MTICHVSPLCDFILIRQALDHPYLVIHGPSRDEAAALAASSQGSSDVCGVCQLNVLSAKDCAVATCRHAFHRECIVEYIEEHKEVLLDTTTTSGVGGGGDGNGKKNGGKNGSSATKKGKAKSPSGGAAAAAGSTCGCPVCFQPLTLTLAIRGAEDSDDDDDDDVSNGAGTPSSAQGKRKRATPSATSSRATKPVLSGAAAGAVTPVTTPAPTPKGGNSGSGGVAECRACCERPRDACYLPCGHIVLCMECTGKLQSKICPMCRAKISRVVKAKDAQVSAATSAASAAMVVSNTEADSSHSSSSSSSSKAVSVTVGRETILQRLNMAEWQSSSKVEAVANAIIAMVRDNASDKGIIFSQYRTMLDLVEWRLKQIPGE
jgi:hypothetical protein